MYLQIFFNCSAFSILFSVLKSVIYRDKSRVIVYHCFVFTGKNDTTIHDELDSTSCNKISLVNSKQSSRPSLTKIVMSLDTDYARQQALQNILQAMQIHLAR